MASVADIIGIRGEIKSILDSANTTTGSPIDLSNNMRRRVQKVYEVNPSILTNDFQLSTYPFISVYADQKLNITGGIAKNQSTASRVAEFEFNVAGVIWDDNVTDYLKDDAQDECLYLMENIERILRSNDRLNNKVLWQIPTQVNYYSVNYSEESHFRAGVMTVNCRIQY